MPCELSTRDSSFAIRKGTNVKRPAILGILLGLATATFAAPASAQTLLHHYTFDSGVTDSVGTDNGALVNGATVSGGVLNLDGVDDYVQFGTHIVPTTGAFSVAFFVQQVGGVQNNFIEWISQGAGGSNFYVGYSAGGNPIRISDAILNTGVGYPAGGAMHHIAVTTTGSSTSLYINGVLANTFATGLPNSAGGTNTRFGRQYGSFSEFWRGTMDDVRIYSGALSGSQVAVLAAGGTAVPEPSAVAMLAGLGVAGSALLRKRSRRA
jgi:hypothetical protein